GGGGRGRAPEDDPLNALIEGPAAAARVRRERLLDLAEAGAAAGAAGGGGPRARPRPGRPRGPDGAGCPSALGATRRPGGVAGGTAEIAGRRGWACVLGWDEEGALACALLAAAGSPEAEALAAEALRAEAAERRERLRAVAGTQV